jgi:hypothetical protein
VDEHGTPIRLEDLVTDADYRELLDIETRVLAECAALRRTQLPVDFREVE